MFLAVILADMSSPRHDIDGLSPHVIDKYVMSYHVLLAKQDTKQKLEYDRLQDS